jgi:hypothetical protein
MAKVGLLIFPCWICWLMLATIIEICWNHWSRCWGISSEIRNMCSSGYTPETSIFVGENHLMCRIIGIPLNHCLTCHPYLELQHQCFHIYISWVLYPVYIYYNIIYISSKDFQLHGLTPTYYFGTSNLGTWKMQSSKYTLWTGSWTQRWKVAHFIFF